MTHSEAYFGRNDRGFFRDPERGGGGGEGAPPSGSSTDDPVHISWPDRLFCVFLFT